MATPAPEHVDNLRLNLEQQRGLLRFTPPLEAQFLEHLHSTQHRSATFTLAVSLAVWVFFTLLDVWRIQQMPTPALTQQFFWMSLMARLPVLVCLMAVLWCLRHPAMRQRYEFFLACSFVTICSAISSSSSVLKSAGMLDTALIIVIIITVAFLPLGVRFRFMLPTALSACVLTTAWGPVLNEGRSLHTHLIVAAVAWLNLLLSGRAAYLREKGQREQFVLRKLLDWEAGHDPLTGLANRRYFHQHLARCIQQAQLEQAPLHLAIADIDHFKLYNDHYGHQAGDEVLRRVAGVLQRCTQQPMDLAVRLGGEEFALVLYNLPEPALQQHLQHLRNELSALALAHATSPTAPCITLSVGATQVRAHDSQDSALLRADNLLYQAKHQGRNRACTDSAAPVATAANAALDCSAPT